MGWGTAGREHIVSHIIQPHLPVYSGTDAGEEALLPFSQSRSRLPGRRLGDMRPDGEGALQRRGGMTESVVFEASQGTKRLGKWQAQYTAEENTRILHTPTGPYSAVPYAQPLVLLHYMWAYSPDESVSLKSTCSCAPFHLCNPAIQSYPTLDSR